jgi:hypothetical protein
MSNADLKRHLKSKHGQQKFTLKQQQPYTHCIRSGSISSNNGIGFFSSFHSPKCKATPLLVGW